MARQTADNERQPSLFDRLPERPAPAAPGRRHRGKGRAAAPQGGAGTEAAGETAAEIAAPPARGAEPPADPEPAHPPPRRRRGRRARTETVGDGASAAVAPPGAEPVAPFSATAAPESASPPSAEPEDAPLPLILPPPEAWSRPALEALVEMLDELNLAAVALAAVRVLRRRLSPPPGADAGESAAEPHPVLVRAARQLAELLAEDDPER